MNTEIEKSYEQRAIEIVAKLTNTPESDVHFFYLKRKEEDNWHDSGIELAVRECARLLEAEDLLRRAVGVSVHHARRWRDWKDNVSEFLRRPRS